MIETEKRFVDLGTFGVEGFTIGDSYMEGIQYLNTGETYEITIVFDSRNEQFSINSWGNIAEGLDNDYL
jgi:hypothetical protein